MKKKILLILALVLAFVGCKKPPEGAVAEIDGKVISQEAYDFEFKNYKNIYQSNADEEFSKLTTDQAESQDLILKKGVLEKLIMRATIEKEYLKSHEDIDEKTFEKAFEAKIEDLGGHDNYNKFLEMNKIDEEFFKASIIENLMVDAIKADYKKEFSPTDEDLKAYYEDHKEELYRYDISMILTDTSDNAYRIMRSHDSFRNLAILNSKDPFSAVNGGELKAVDPVDLPDELVDYVKNGPVGEYADPIESPDGFYVLRVDKVYKDYDSLIEVVKDKYFEENFKKHLEEIRDSNHVKVYMDLK